MKSKSSNLNPEFRIVSEASKNETNATFGLIRSCKSSNLSPFKQSDEEVDVSEDEYGEENISSTIGQRSKRKRSSIFTEGKIKEASAILRNLGKDVMGKDVEILNSSDPSLTKGNDNDITVHVSCLEGSEKDLSSEKKVSQINSFLLLYESYKDVLHCNKKPFYLKDGEEDANIMDSYLMHSLNHILNSRDIIKKNDAKLAKLQEVAREQFLASGTSLDHGFTRPKVLMLVPFRSVALRVVKRLIHLTPEKSKTNVEYLDRFCQEYGCQNDEEIDSDSRHSQKSSKPSDYQKLFGGNCDDTFMLGIKFTKKCIKLFSEFYSSDMIVASPLQLHTKIEEAEVNKEKDFDYLSSIEVLVVDHADVISMQNWAFLDSVLENLNRIPSKQHGTDIMRIKSWYLNGEAKHHRQSIILSHYATPDINATFNRLCVNHNGKIKTTYEHKGVLGKVMLQVKQVYERFDVANIPDADDARLDYFIKKVFPRIKDSVQGGIMVFMNSYFEFVRIRNFMKSQNASFCLLGDYTEQSDISRSRVWFFEGTRKIMLYSERAHFYHRYKIRGIKYLIMYSLPERKEFYPEILNMLQDPNEAKCTVLVSRYDRLRMERIVGNSYGRKMMSSEKDVFAFC